MGHKRLLLALIVFRIINVLTIKTFFQPDEYWQSLEPAHRLVYGYGYLTWEWRERLRSAAHPLLYAAVYKIGNAISIDPVLAPKLFQAGVAAIGDFYQYKLAERLLGNRAGARLALTASIGSAFNWFVMTRTFSNSLEMVLTTVALAYWPWGRTVIYRDFCVALGVAAVSCIFRPTNALIWGYLGVLTVWRTRSIKVVLIAATVAVLSLGINTLVDWWYYGEMVFPLLKFVQFNVVQSLSQFYGTSPWHYYLFQGLPLLLVGYLPLTLHELYKSPTHPLTGLVIFVVSCYSLLRHKEVRFIYPLVPVLHVILARRLLRVSVSRRRLMTVIIFLLNAPIALYFGMVHQRGVIDVVDSLRNDSSVQSIGFLMPCHSTPWQSHLHRDDIDAWFLTCEPPINVAPQDRDSYLDEADQFYEDPLKFLDTVQQWPTHLSFFEQLEPTVSDYLEAKGYTRYQSFFNSHFHDDWRRVGDVVVYRKSIL